MDRYHQDLIALIFCFFAFFCGKGTFCRGDVGGMVIICTFILIG